MSKSIEELDAFLASRGLGPSTAELHDATLDTAAQEEDPLDAFLAKRAQEMGLDSAVAPPRQEGLLEKAAGLAGTFLRGTVDPRAKAAIAGGAASTILTSVANLADLPEVTLEALSGVDTEVPLFSTSSNLLKATARKFEEAGQQISRGLGLSEEQVRSLNGMGQLIGYVAPALASWKAAGLVGKIPGLGIVQAPVAQDMTAGIIFGLGFEEGPLSERAKQAALQAGFAGAFGVMTKPMYFAYKGVMNTRLVGGKLGQRVLDGIDSVDDALTGTTTVQVNTEEAARQVNKVLTEGTFISQTTGGVRALTRYADERAIVDAYTEMLTGGRSHAVVSGIGDLDNVLTKMKDELPHLKIQSIPRGENTGDIIFGHTGLNAQQMKDFARQGVFPGQRVMLGNKEFEFVKLAKHPKKGTVVLAKDGTGQITALNIEKVTFAPFGSPELPSDIEGGLIDNFVQWMKTKVDDLSVAREEPQLSELRQSFTAEGAALTPEESGIPQWAREKMIEQGLDPNRVFNDIDLSNPSVVEAINADPTLTPEQKAVILQTGGLPGIAKPQPGDIPLAPIEPFTTEDLVEMWAREMGMLQGAEPSIPEGFVRLYRGASLKDPARPGEFAGRWFTDDLDTARGYAAIRDKPGRVYYVDISAEEYAKIPQMEHTRTAQQFNLSIDQAARKKLLPETSPLDLDSFKVHANARLRQEMRTAARDYLEPGELAKYDEIDRRLTAAMAENVDDLDFLAEAKGFYIRRLDDGRVLLRDINSGTPHVAANEKVALAGLRSSGRYPKDMMDTMGLPPILSKGGGGGPPTDSGPFEMLVPEPGKPPTAREYRVMMHKPVARNVLDWTKEVETMTEGRIPLWSRGSLRLIEANGLHNNEVLPLSFALEKVFKGYKTRDITRLMDYFQQAAGVTDGAKLRTIMDALSLTPKQRHLIPELQRLDRLVVKKARALGIEMDSYISTYAKLIRPMMEELGPIGNKDLRKAFIEKFGKDVSEGELEFLVRHYEGNLSLVDKDFRMVFTKVFRDLSWERNIRPIWDELYPLVKRDAVSGRPVDPFGLSKFGPEEGERIVAAVGGRQAVDNMALVLEEMLAAIKGQPELGPDIVSGFMSQLMRTMGVKSDSRLNREFATMMMTNIYGATMGLRPRVIVRDWFQNYWNLGTRLGFGDASESMRRSMSEATFQKWLQAGALRPQQRGLPQGDVFDQIMEKIPIQQVPGSGALGWASTGAAKFIFRAGRGGRKWSEKFLKWYSSQDEMLRAWAAEWQYIHTERWLNKFNVGDITEKKFLEKGLPFYSKAVKKEFLKRAALSSEDALLFIGREAADEANFVYGALAQPAWMQTNWGRLVGTFGTWPMWQAEIYLRRIRYGTWAQRAAFVARTGAIASAIGFLGHQTYTNLSSWMSPDQWFGYAGGPGIDLAYDARQIIRAPWDRKAAALRTFASEIPRLAIPGQGAFRDITQTLQAANRSMELGAYSMMMGRPQDFDGNYWMQIMLNPDLKKPELTLRNLDRARRRAREIDAWLQDPQSVGASQVVAPPSPIFDVQGFLQTQARPATPSPLPSQPNGPGLPASSSSVTTGSQPPR